MPWQVVSVLCIHYNIEKNHLLSAVYHQECTKNSSYVLHHSAHSLLKLRVHVVGGYDTLLTTGLLLVWWLVRGLLHSWWLNSFIILVSQSIYHCPCVNRLINSLLLQLASSHEACLPCETSELVLTGLGSPSAWGRPRPLEQSSLKWFT